jgi:LacI family transcriptional regulator
LKGRAVLVDTAVADFPSIELDIPQGVRCALAHLFEVGHKKIAHLAANIPLETFNSRREAYLAALSDAGLPVRPDYLINSAFSIEAAQQAATHLLTCRPKPTAIFCDSDVLAVGVYKAARKLGLNIPADLSVVGFDNSMIATIVEPELTTVAVPVESVGQAAIQLLLKAITGAGARATSRIPLTLVVRGSTAMPAADRTGRHAKRLHA